MALRNLSQSEIRREFSLVYEQSDFTQMVNSIAVRTRASARLDVFGTVSPFPRLRRSLGGNETSAPVPAFVTVENIRYQAAEKIDIDDFRRDQTGQVGNRVTSAAESAAARPFDSIKAMIVAGTATCYDGSALFAASRSYGASGTQKNILTVSDITALGAVATAASPTPEEMADVILALKGYLTGIKDSRGEQMFNRVAGLTFIVPGNIEGAMWGAIDANNLAGGRTNAAKSLSSRGINLSMYERGDFFSSTNGADFYMIVDPGSASTRPFIVTDDVPPYVDFLGEGSEYATQHDAVLVKAGYVGGVAPGEPLTIFKITLS
jgi:hypothetical protein